MKTSRITLGLLILITLTASATFAQQAFIQTVTKLNTSCNYKCSLLDVPELNGNPAALIFVTPILENGRNLNPHPIGAYYRAYEKKWSIFNLDGAAIAEGAKLKVEYYTPDANHFVYVAPPLVHSNDVRYLDRAVLNNYQNAQVRVFPTNSPPNGINGANFNQTEVRPDYDVTTSKWFIYNVINPPTSVPAGTGYNIMVSNGGSVITNPNAGKDLNNTNVKTPVSGGSCNCVIPTSLPPNGNAGGDLSGTYPNPTVTGLRGQRLSIKPPVVGQVLKWNGSAWESAADEVGTASSPTSTNSMQTFFKNGSEMSPTLSNNEEFYFVNHKYTITVTANSRLIISGNFRVHSLFCLGCQPAYTSISLYVNTVFNAVLAESWTAPSGDQNASVSNYMMDITPGTYIIQFNAGHNNVSNSASAYIYANISSIIVVPQ